MRYRNARFWVYWNGDHVKLTLEPGQSLGAHSGYFHEEGSHSERCSWEHMGGYVCREWEESDRDCDGPSSRSGEDTCSIVALSEGNPGYDDSGKPMDDIRMPDWCERTRACRDVYAEIAGY